MKERTDIPATGIVNPAHPAVADPPGRYYICPSCAQAVDTRDLGQLIHHALFDAHEPLPADARRA